jgi:hypothetical protein
MATATLSQLDQTLLEVASASRQLDRILAQVIRDAQQARTALSQGHAVAGSTMGAGPLGHQAPFDVAMTTTRLNGLIQQALMLGATSDQITRAYTVGGPNA